MGLPVVFPFPFFPLCARFGPPAFWVMEPRAQRSSSMWCTHQHPALASSGAGRSPVGELPFDPAKKR